jgi:hypothetical protein
VDCLPTAEGVATGAYRVTGERLRFEPARAARRWTFSRRHWPRVRPRDEHAGWCREIPAPPSAPSPQSTTATLRRADGGADAPSRQNLACALLIGLGAPDRDPQTFGHHGHIAQGERCHFRMPPNATSNKARSCQPMRRSPWGLEAASATKLEG